jgi:pectinesterase
LSRFIHRPPLLGVMAYIARWLGTALLVATVIFVACTDSGHGDASGQGGALQSGGNTATGGQVKATGGSLGTGGQAGSGGTTGSGGAPSSGGVPSSGGSGAGGVAGGGGSTATGGQPATGGRTSMGGTIAAGGSTQTGGQTGGSTSSGGATASGGALTGGTFATGGRAGTGGITATGGATNSGGASTGGTGGPSATGGATATGGTTGTGGSTSQSCGSIASTATRPQLSTAAAANYTTAKYLAGGDSWNPTAGITLPSSPTYTVAADGSGDATTVKGALAKATGSSRVNILVKAGTYREKISISGSTPITLYGADADASKVVIVYGDSNDSAGGTPQSATFTVSNPGFQAKNLTFANDLDENASGCTNCQALAFYSTGDKLVFDNVRFIGNQDTIYFDSTGTNTVARVYLKSSYAEGDTDYIFGRATMVMEDSEMHYTSLRKPTNAGRQIAPSTAAANQYGYLFNRCKFTADAATLTNKIYLGRSWDQNVATAADWNASSSPNGQAVIRESVLGAHIRLADPWAAAATSGRAYDSNTNRFSEYCNSGPGAG